MTSRLSDESIPPGLSDEVTAGIIAVRLQRRVAAAVARDAAKVNAEAASYEQVSGGTVQGRVELATRYAEMVVGLMVTSQFRVELEGRVVRHTFVVGTVDVEGLDPTRRVVIWVFKFGDAVT